jgi:tetratricopeptide (TPR) repeat protein
VGLFESALGHFELAMTAARRAVSLDPQNVGTRRLLAMVLINARRYTEALVVLQDARLLFPGSHDIEGVITVALLASRQIDKARKACESPSTPLDDDGRHFCLALAYHALGRQVDAERDLEQLKAIDGDAEALSYAEIYAQWGNKAAALQWLSKAERQGDAGLAPLRVNWFFDPIRNEPQFKAIVARMNFPP